MTFCLQNQGGNDFCDVRLENNVKRQYATVSHEFEWKSLYWDKIVREGYILLPLMHECLFNAEELESTAMKLSKELAAMVSTLLT